MALKIIEREVIEDDAVTSAKVEDGTVVGADIVAGSITNADVKSDAAIAASKITGLATSATTDTTNASNIASGTLPTARLDTGTTANKIVLLDGNAKLPAISGANLTGIESATVSTSDPVIATNPSGGVGTKWINKTSGEVYICTDATAGENVWTNVGAGSGDISPWVYPATSYIYVLGGRLSPNNYNYIERFSVTSDGNTVDWADLNEIGNGNGSSSATHGYMAAGHVGTPHATNRIEKFPFASQTNGTDVGDMTNAVNQSSGFQSLTYGYTGGGRFSGSPSTDVIDKYAHATDGNATDIGNCVGNTYYDPAGINSRTNGYIGGGIVLGSPGGTNLYNMIQKVSFSSDGNSTDIADMTRYNGGVRGCGTETYGYICGGYTIPGDFYDNKIEKFSYSSEANTTDIADLSMVRGWHAASSSTTHGYNIGGDSPSTNSYDKFSFSTEGNATDVADISSARAYMGTAQY